MCRPEALSAWVAELASVFPLLSKPQVKVLAEYSMGVVLAGRSGLSCVAFALSQWLGQKFEAVRERLRDWYCGASDKSGAARVKPVRRRELEVEACFAPLLGWVLRDWQGTELAIALDATTLGERFVVLAVAVAYRSCAVPVAWVVLPAKAKGAWEPHWLALLARFKQIVPPHLQVIALADRGLYARWLFRAIVALGWHPFLRLNTHNGEFRPEGGGYLPLAGLLPEVGATYEAKGTLFRSEAARQDCTLLARWGEGYESGWFVATDLPPDRAECAWYGLRGWVERGFRHLKSGGWGWGDTRMTDPARAGRQWLAMAVASVLLLRQGTAHDAPRDPAPQPPAPPPQAPAPVAPHAPVTASPAPARPRRRRVLSVFRMGLIAVQIAWLTGSALPRGYFAPEPRPTSSPPARGPTPDAQPP